MDRQQLETSAALEAFARDLTDLSRKHGIAINGAPDTYLMERDDYERAYRTDTESRVEFI